MSDTTIRDVVIKLHLENDRSSLQMPDFSAATKGVQEYNDQIAKSAVNWQQAQQQFAKLSISHTSGGGFANGGGIASEPKSLNHKEQLSRVHEEAAREMKMMNKTMQTDDHGGAGFGQSLMRGIHHGIATRSLQQGLRHGVGDFLNKQMSGTHGGDKEAKDAHGAIDAYNDLQKQMAEAGKTYDTLTMAEQSAFTEAKLGAGAAADSLATMAAQATLVGGTIAASMAIAAAAVYVYRESVIAARDIEQEYLTEVSDQATRNTAFVGQSAIRHSQQSALLMRSVTDTASDTRRVQFSGEHGELEESIRDQQDASPRDFEYRQQIRHRAETRAGSRERELQARDQVEHLKKQREIADQSVTRHEKDTRNLGQSHDVEMASIEREKRGRGAKEGVTAINTSGSSNVDWLSEQFQGWGEWSLTGDSKRIREEHNAGVTKRKGEAEQQFNHASEELSKEGVDANRERNDLIRQQGEAAERVLNITREQVKETRLLAEMDRQRVDAANQHVGAMDEGDVMILKNLDDKAKRIEGQQARRKNGENVEVEEMFPWEMRMAMQFDGPMADVARAQAQHRGEKRGIRTRTKEAEESQRNADEAQRNASKEEPELLKAIKEHAQASEAGLAQFTAAINKMVTAQEVAAQFDKFATEWRKEFEAWKVRRQSWWGSG